MSAKILLLVCALNSVVWSNDWTPRVATEGALVTLEKQSSPAPLPKPNPDGAAKGAKVEGLLDSYHGAKALIEKSNALADRGKAILDQAEQDGKITVDIRMPQPPIMDLTFQEKARETSGGGTCADGTCPSGTCSNRSASNGTCAKQNCPTGRCPFRAQADDQSSTSNEPAQDCARGACKPRRFLRWRR